MKKFDRFFEQIQKTKQRTNETIDMKPVFKNNNVRLPESAIDNVSTFRDGNTGALIDFALVKQLETIKIQKENRPVVNPRQVTKFIQTNKIDFTRFIDDAPFRERIINGDDSLDASYTARGAQANKSICRINIIAANGEEEGFGTGFLISPNILITNNHVLPLSDFAIRSYAEFNYEKGVDDLPMTSRFFKFEPTKLFYTNVDLDYTIVFVSENATDGEAKLSEFGFLRLNPQLGKTKEGNCVSIIQHPDGKMKKVALRENKITNLSLSKVIRYSTDTKSGSSGSPVFNDRWEVVGLHHSGVPRYNEAGEVLNTAGGIWDQSQGETAIDWVENEGIRVSSIIYDITTNAIVNFPFLLQYFSPIQDMETITKSMGITLKDLEVSTYYPEAIDARDKGNYYSGIDEISRVSFAELTALLVKTHSTHQNYNPSKLVYPKIDLHPDGLLRSIYSGREFDVQELILADEKVDIERKISLFELTKSEGSLEATKYNKLVDDLESALPYNCEHVVCQSWFKKQEPMRGDLHHLFACESRCNSFRNNHPYHDFPGYQPQPVAAIEKERATCGNMEEDMFEPENNKGIVARAVLYFLVRYPRQISVYSMESINTLKAWAIQQPVTLYEKHRNREIFLTQGNRNPFIDFPDLVGTFDFSNALSDPPF